MKNLQVNVYQAECGDAISLRFRGSDKKYHNIFIDSGYERTFSHILEEEIKSIEVSREQIDLWIISHIHDDHIGGITSYIDAIKNNRANDIVDNWYYNSPRVKNDLIMQEISSAKSIEQGDYLSDYLESIGKIPKKDICNTLQAQKLFGIELFILSPDKVTLNKLREKYGKGKYGSLSYEELTEISESVSARKNDYDVPVSKLIVRKYKEDTSIENRSSIATLIKCQKDNFLFLSDSHPSVILKSLKKLGYSKKNPVKCALTVVTHHGSKSNNSPELYNHIKCKKYVFSVNGENRHYLPNKETLIKILTAKKRNYKDHYQFYFTYDSSSLRQIFKKEGRTIFKDLNFSLIFHNGKKLQFPFS